MLNLDEIDWLLVIGVILGAIASVTKEFAEFLGIETVSWLILFLKIVAAILSVAFAILKFLRLRPYIKLVDSDEYTVEGDEERKWFYIDIPKSIHKKGKTPTVECSLVSADDKPQNINLSKIILDDGCVQIGGFGLGSMEKKLQVVIKP